MNVSGEVRLPGLRRIFHCAFPPLWKQFAGCHRFVSKPA
jgi:hypothetical protein